MVGDAINEDGGGAVVVDDQRVIVVVEILRRDAVTAARGPDTMEGDGPIARADES